MLHVLSIAAGVLAGLLLAGAVWERIAEARFVRRHPAPGRLVQVGGRRLHLLCEGSGPGPTVVIEQGAGEPATVWRPIQRRLAGTMRVCLYDRAGYQWSDPCASSRSLTDRAEELHALLTAAGVPGPYILVGHSYGGVICQVFAAGHPEDVAGLVLVDAPERAVILRPAFEAYRRQFLRVVAIGRTLARIGLVRLLLMAFSRPDGEMTRELTDAMNGFIAHPGASLPLADELRSLSEGGAELTRASAPGLLGHRPVAVITHTRRFPGFAALLEPGWLDGQRRLAALSSRGTLVLAEKSNHMIQAEEPELVIEAVRRVWDQSLVAFAA